MTRTLAAIALAAGVLLTGCAHTAPPTTDRAFAAAMRDGAPHCTSDTVRSIAGIYCQTAMPNPYLDSDV
jgi:curli biogenesis system outer membrane secretion channel CsgG